MESLVSYQIRLMQHVGGTFFRFLYDKIPWQERFLAIRGPRGVGKTTMLLQYARYQLNDPQRNLYLSLDHPYFYDHDLLSLAEDFVNQGGHTLLLDEIHKYPNWSNGLKHLYDAYPDLQVVFTSSSALDLYRGEADLSRRVSSYILPGLSFREYLTLVHGISLPAYSLRELLDDHIKISMQISGTLKPLEMLDDYLKFGYFPFTVERPEEIYQQQLFQAIETTLLHDISFVEDYSVANVQKMQQLLSIIAESAPFSPNISKLAERMGIGRNAIKTYIFLLGKAQILQLLQRKGKGISRLQKPQKIYLDNTNFSYALKSIPDKGNIRETFFLNQMRNAGYSVYYPGESYDFIIDDGTSFEVGGKHKKAAQSLADYIVKDGILHGSGSVIPLYLFGFLY